MKRTFRNSTTCREWLHPDLAMVVVTQSSGTLALTTVVSHRLPIATPRDLVTHRLPIATPRGLVLPLTTGTVDIHRLPIAIPRDLVTHRLPIATPRLPPTTVVIHRLPIATPRDLVTHRLPIATANQRLPIAKHRDLVPPLLKLKPRLTLLPREICQCNILQLTTRPPAATATIPGKRAWVFHGN